ncbi:unnamed protein product [Closterium sp. NIES-54]
MSVEVIFYEMLSLEVWKTKFGPASGQTQSHPPMDTSAATVPLLAEVDEPTDEDVVEVLPPPAVLAPPFPIADRPASTHVSATGDEGSLEASPVAPAKGITGGPQNAKLVDQDGKPSTTGEQKTREPVEQEGSAGVQSIGELSKSAEDLAVNDEGELSAGKESTDGDVVEVPITKPELRRTGRARRPPERLSFHACLPPASFTAVYDDAEEDEELRELDPNMHADPEHRWDIATMTIKEALASWKGEAVKAAMEEEIRSLIGMGTWELVERPRGVNIMKNRWVLTTKYRIDDTVEREKARLFVKGFTQVCGADYDKTYSLLSSYVTLRIFLNIVAVLDLNLMQLDMKNSFLQSKLDRVLYMYQPDYFDDGTGRVCKLLKSLYGLKPSPLLWYRALDVYVDDLLAASSSHVMLKKLKGPLEAVFELREISPVVKYLGLEIVRDRPARKLWLHQQGYADKLRRHFIDEEQGGRVPKTQVFAYAELTFDDEEAQEREEEEYRQKVGSLQFATTTTRPDIAFACSKLGSGLTVLQHFGFQFSLPQCTPLSTSHSLSAPPSDESVESSGPYPELVGCLMYLMMCTRPDLTYPLSLLARYVAPGRHRKMHWDAAKRVVRYLCSTSGMGLVLGGRGPLVLTSHADASWVDDSATQRSSQGFTFSLGSGSVSWRSTRSSSVLSSSCDAEIYVGAMAAQELRWLTYLLSDLGEQPCLPPVLYVDNKAMIALCQEHRLEHRTKHIALRFFLARELQKRGQLRLAYVATWANTADIFTKALPPGDHQCFSTVLGLVPTLPHLLTA